MTVKTSFHWVNWIFLPYPNFNHPHTFLNVFMVQTYHRPSAYRYSMTLVYLNHSCFCGAELCCSINPYTHHQTLYLLHCSKNHCWLWQIVFSKDDCNDISHPTWSSYKMTTTLPIECWGLCPLSLNIGRISSLLWPIKYGKNNTVWLTRIDH